MVKEAMFEFRLHGRGGQGLVIAASIFAEAVFHEGRFARAFSLFGAERRGAPVTAFIRVGAERLMPRNRIYQPDCVVVLDPTLSGIALKAGLKAGGIFLVNAAEEGQKDLPEEAITANRFRLFTVDATEIARKHGLTVGGFPLVNTVMLGAMARVSGFASLDNLVESVKKRITTSIEANVRAVNEGAEKVKGVEGLVS